MHWLVSLIRSLMTWFQDIHFSFLVVFVSFQSFTLSSMFQKQREKKFPKFKRCSCQILHQAGFQNENFINSLPIGQQRHPIVKVKLFEIKYQRETHSMGSKPEKKIKHLKKKLKIIQLHCKSININFTVQKKTSAQVIHKIPFSYQKQNAILFNTCFITCKSGAVVDTRRRVSNQIMEHYCGIS